MSPLPIPGLDVTLLAPGALAAGVAVGAGIVVLHAIRVGRPPVLRLPTARFAPERPPRAVRRLTRPADLALLALRLTAVGGIALALARPVPTPPRRTVARVVLADASRAADAAGVAEALGTLARGGGLTAGDVLVAFAGGAVRSARVPALAPAAGTADSAAARAGWATALLDSTRARPGAEAVPGALAPALVAARRAADSLAIAADSLELIVLSPVAREQVDAALAPVRATWGGRGRLVRTATARAARVGAPTGVADAAAGVATPGRGRAVRLDGAAADDPLAAALALDGRDGGAQTAPVRVVRAASVPADAERWLADAAGRVLVLWPADGRPAGWTARPATDSAVAIVAGEGARAVAAVGPFRRASEPGDGAAAGPTERRVIARWADGSPAAVERATGRGCRREVGIALPRAGDLALLPAFRAVAAALVAPCGMPTDLAPAAPALLRALARPDAPLLDARPLRAALRPPAPDRVGAALLALALAALAGELLLRRFRGAASDTRDDGADVSDGSADDVTRGRPAAPRRATPEAA